MLQIYDNAIQKMAAVCQEGTQEYAEGSESMVVLLGDKEFLLCDDEARMADLYMCRVHMGEG